MPFGWFNATEAQSFGSSLAVFFVERLPVAERTSSKKFEVKARDALEKMQRQVIEFRTSHRLNLYTKAKLGNAFKWKLREAGLDKDYSDKLTEWLMLQLQ